MKQKEFNYSKYLLRVLLSFAAALVFTLIVSVNHPGSLLYFLANFSLWFITFLAIDSLFINKGLTDKQKIIIAAVLGAITLLGLIIGLSIYSHLYGYQALHDYLKTSLEPLTR